MKSALKLLVCRPWKVLRQFNRLRANGIAPATFLFAFAAFLFFPRASLTEPDPRCDWAECQIGKEEPSESESGRSEWDATLPVCGKEDDTACADKCHGEFDADHGRCIAKCLRRRCANPSARLNDSDSSANAEDQSLGCLALHSEDCDKECRQGSSKSRASCRRGCLQRVCPSANPKHLAMEAADPGSTQCDFCREKNKADCEKSCLLGVFQEPGKSSNGLVGFGCEKICMITACGRICGMRIP